LVQAGFRLSETNLPSVLRICQLVEGMPLGLELAAARTELLAPTEIADEIAQSIDFLASEWHDLPVRQRSMRAVFEWSWALLNAGEQRVLARLAVFRGGFTRAAAAAVADASLGTLASLTQKALLRVGTVHEPETRYDLHELLRQFALEQLSTNADEHAAVAARHSSFYLAMAEGVAPKLDSDGHGAGQVALLNQIERDHDNMRVALGRAREQGDLAFGLRLGGALWPFWQRRCHLSEGRRWLEGFLEAAEAETVAPEVRATALNGAGWLAHDQDDFGRAEALFSAGLALDRALGQTGRVAAVLAHRGCMARAQGQYAAALALLEESLALARAAENRASIAFALFSLGMVTRERGEFARAAAIYAECLATYRALDDRGGAAFALLGLGDIARDQGDARQVEIYCTESMAICRELQQHWGVGFSLNSLGLAAAMQGDMERALLLTEQAFALLRRHGIRGGVVELLIIRGQLACDRGAYAAAQATLIEGLALGWSAGPHWLMATGLEELARVNIAAGNSVKATQLCAAAAAWRSQMEAPLQPYRRAALEATLAAARTALGEQAFAAVWAEGSAWPPEQAIAVGLAGA
jgi:tetratricopeptide (TPR) repeat protein